jgi:REP element-mobilizing transposase RayT
MPRPLRPLVPGAIYHVFTRTRPDLPLFVDDIERQLFLKLLAGTVAQRRWSCLAYCLMGTHVHLIVRTPAADLDAGMQSVLSSFAIRLNTRRETRGPVFGGRYGCRLIEHERYLSEVLRYVVLNPVRAGLCAQPSQWPWSSHLALAGHAAPGLLAVDEVYDLIGAQGPDGYVAVVEAARAAEPIHAGLSGWSREMADRPPLAELLQGGAPEGVSTAHREHGYSLRAIARQLGLNVSTVSRRLRAYEARVQRNGSDPAVAADATQRV